MEGKQMQKDRTKYIGGSDATRIVEGDWYQLWSEKVGETKQADLSDILPVQMGICTEEFNLQWFEKLYEKEVSDKQSFITMKDYKFIAANVDGIVKQDNAIIDAKHTNAFSNPAKVADKYNAQMQHYMMVTNTEKAYLSTFFGNMKYELVAIDRDQVFMDRLLNAELLFWHFVTEKKAPPEYMSFENFEKENTNDQVISVLSRV